MLPHIEIRHVNKVTVSVLDFPVSLKSFVTSRAKICPHRHSQLTTRTNVGFFLNINLTKSLFYKFGRQTNPQTSMQPLLITGSLYKAL